MHRNLELILEQSGATDAFPGRPVGTAGSPVGPSIVFRPLAPRLSGDDLAASIARQEEACREFCRRMGVADFGDEPDDPGPDDGGAAPAALPPDVREEPSPAALAASDIGCTPCAPDGAYRSSRAPTRGKSEVFEPRGAEAALPPRNTRGYRDPAGCSSVEEILDDDFQEPDDDVLHAELFAAGRRISAVYVD